jgi:peptide/nickel transport system substrate-binding protein
MTDEDDEYTISRRKLLQAGAVGGMLLGGGGLLTACSSASPATGSSPSAKPKYGGKLRIALAGGAASDTLDAQALVTLPDQARVIQLYNSPVEFNTNAGLRMSLAEEITSNSTATEWTMRMRPGVEFHNGKTLTADDVIFSFQRIMNPKNPKPGAAQLSLLDYKNLKKLDQRTVLFPFSSPFSPFVQLLADYYYFVVPVGYDPAHPVGTGPFKYQSFTPGQQSTFVRNPHYWEQGLPYVDEVVINDFADETSQINALISGQVDAIDALSAASIASLRSQGQKVVISNSGSYTPITMRVDVAPFNDVRVRQALRYVADREQMLQHVFGGHGLVGNDLFSINDPDYNHSIPQRTQDLDKAKSLLKAAGQSGMHVQLATAPIAAGVSECAQVFAQQASAAGINIGIQSITATAMFGPNYLKWPFAFDTWPSIYFLSNVGEGQVPGAPYNESHFNNPQFNQLYKEALATIDPVKQRNLAHEMQVIYWNEGGYIIPYFTPFIDGHSPRLNGVVPSKGLPLSQLGFKRFWFG